MTESTLKPSTKPTTGRPHLCPKGRAIFITWHLVGAMPPGVALDIRKTPNLTPGEKFVRGDSYLDTHKRGPQHLKDERVAAEVSRAIENGATGDVKHYDLHEYVVMPNHVHMLITPHVEMNVLMRRLKGYTAHFANELLGCHGQSFWQQSYFDRYCRDDKEFEKIRRYIAMNPVKAKLAARPEDWKWSSAARRGKKIEELRMPVAALTPRPKSLGRTGDKSVAATRA
jgi:putative transposase